MIAAFSVSVAFLISYLVYHYEVGSVRFQKTGTIRTVYLTILLTHTVLAAAVPFLAGIALYRGLRGRLCQASPDGEMGAANLAVCERYGRGGLLDAVPDVISEPVPLPVREVRILPSQSRCFERYSVQT